MFTKYDKAAATVIAGAVSTLIVYFFPMDANTQAALQTVVGAGLVWAASNKS